MSRTPLPRRVSHSLCKHEPQSAQAPGVHLPSTRPSLERLLLRARQISLAGPLIRAPLAPSLKYSPRNCLCSLTATAPRTAPCWPAVRQIGPAPHGCGTQNRIPRRILAVCLQFGDPELCRTLSTQLVPPPTERARGERPPPDWPRTRKVPGPYILLGIWFDAGVRGLTCRHQPCMSGIRPGRLERNRPLSR